ncbi:MAG: flagellar motor switch protein FliM [Defluviitaleaceae bacterium]|nr:flagellar motor switch protein FliM [Defluviitaleaceae bacterium]
MGDILSQSEIDALLNALSSGDSSSIVVAPDAAAAKEAKKYDFARPSKFSKEQLRTLEIIFDNYSRLVSSFLTAYLRTTVYVEVANAEQLTYNEFNNSLVNPVVLGIISFRPLKGSVIIEMSSNIGYSIIDRILGGPGLSMKKLRDFSDIEKILLDRVINQMLTYLPEPWENVIAVEPSLDKIETNSQFAQIISPNEMIALVTLSIKIGSSEGLINFCIPHMVIESIMDRLNTKYWFRQAHIDETDSYREDLESQLDRAQIPVSAIIGRTSVTVRDFVEMQVGDIIPLDSYTTSDLRIMIGNLLKFYAKPGINRGRNAIQITQLIAEEEQ